MSNTIYDHTNYKVLFFDKDVYQDIKTIRDRVSFIINHMNNQSGDNLLFLKNKTYSVDNIMKLASCTNYNENCFSFDLLHENAISVLTFAILNGGWSETIIKTIEKEIIKKCFYQQYITKTEYNYLNKKYKKSINKKISNDTITYILDYLWNKCYFNRLYRDRLLKKKITLKLIKKCNKSLSFDILNKHDLSFFSLPIAAGIVVYEYLTQKNTSLQIVKDAAKLLISEEKYIRYTKKIDNSNLDGEKRNNIGISITDKKKDTNCALLLCKSMSKNYCPTKDTKCKIFNLNRLFEVIDIDNENFRKCLGLVYDSIDVRDLLPNITQGSKSLDWYFKFNNIMNTKNTPIKNDRVIEGDNISTDPNENTIQEPIYNDIEEHVYLNMDRKINKDEYVLPSVNVQVSDKKDLQNNHEIEDMERYKVPRQILPNIIYDVPKNMSSVYRVPNHLCHHYNTLPKKSKAQKTEWTMKEPSITSYGSFYDIPKTLTSIYDCKNLMIQCHACQKYNISPYIVRCNECREDVRHKH